MFMKIQVRTLLFVLLLIPVATLGQNNPLWEFDTVFPDTLNYMHKLSHIQGITVDASGRVWVQPHFSSETIGDDIPVNAIYIFDSRGRELDFSPLRTITVHDETDTLFGGGRGLTADKDGTILISQGDALYRVDHHTGEGINKVIPTPGEFLTPPSITESGHILTSHIFPGNPVHIYDKDFKKVTVVKDIKEDFTRTIEISPDGREIYYFPYQLRKVYKYYSPHGVEGPYTLADSTLLEGMAVKSSAWHPASGHLWVSAGSEAYLPTEDSGFMHSTWYAYDTQDDQLKQRITWHDIPEFQSVLPRGITFSNNGRQVYLVNFTHPFLPGIQRFKAVPSQAAGIVFTAVLSVSDTGRNSANLTFGTARQATSGFKEGMDVLAPPSPPDGAFDARIRIDDNDYFTKYLSSGNPTNVWEVHFKPEQPNTPIFLDWDPDKLNDRDAFFLSGHRKNEGEITVNMHEKSSFVVTDNLEKLYIIQNSPAQLSYKSGWNLVGLAADNERTGYNNIFRTALSGSLYTFEGEYKNKNRLEPGTGYWLNFYEADTINIKSTSLERLQIDLREGWNMISGLSVPMAISEFGDPEGSILDGTLYGYETGSYLNADTLEPGRGYWLRAASASAVTLSSADTSERLARNTNTSSITDHFHALTLGIAGQTEQTLYFGSGLPDNVNHLNFSLPPLPPAAAFDVRFEHNLRLTEAGEADIQLQGVSDGLTAMLSLAGNQDKVDEIAYSLKIIDSDEITDMYLLENGQELNLEGSLSGKKLRISPVTTHSLTEEHLPATFSLGQNYPNPFNPATTISYNLSETVDVRLEVYDMLGRRVSVLQAGSQSAGRYTVSFDAAGLSSGSYIYRLTTPDFVQTRKMMLVK